MKHNKNQVFTSFDFFTVVVSFAVILGVSTPIIKQNLQTGNVELAQKEAHFLAYTLLKSKEPSTLRTASETRHHSERSIASIEKEGTWEGETGKDPWGNPYHFRFLRNAQGAPAYLVVWSDGVEMKDQAPEVKLSPVDGLEHINLKNDSVAAVVPVR